MRKFLCILLLLALGISSGAQNVVFDHIQYDFGTHREDGGSIPHKFEFTNKGIAPVVVSGVQTGCRCTRYEYSEGSIAPGAKGYVTLIYEPWDFPGEAQKSAKVQFSDGTTAILHFHVNIIPRIHPVEEVCPIELKDGVRLERWNLDMRQLKIGSSKQASLEWGHVGRFFHILKIRPGRGTELKISCPSVVKPGERGTIVLTYDLSRYGGAPRFVRDSCTVMLDGRPYGILSTFIAFIPPGMESVEKPKLSLNSQYHNFGVISRSGQVQKPFTLVIKNSGTGPLAIYDLDIPRGVSLDKQLPDTLAPGQQFTVQVKVNPGSSSETRLFSNLSLLTSDPDSPVKEIILSAKIK